MIFQLNITIVIYIHLLTVTYYGSKTSVDINNNQHEGEPNINDILFYKKIKTIISKDFEELSKDFFGVYHVIVQVLK